MTMKKLNLTTEKVLAAYNVVSTAKYSKLEDADKIKVWKIARALKPVATKFDEDTRDAAEKMKPSDDYNDRLMKARQYERLSRQKDADMSKSEMGPAEYDAFMKEFEAYNKLVADTIKDFAKKEVEIEFEPITEDAFCKLMDSNDWTIDQVTILGDIICE